MPPSFLTGSTKVPRRDWAAYEKGGGKVWGGKLFCPGPCGSLYSSPLILGASCIFPTASLSWCTAQCPFFRGLHQKPPKPWYDQPTLEGDADSTLPTLLGLGIDSPPPPLTSAAAAAMSSSFSRFRSALLVSASRRAARARRDLWMAWLVRKHDRDERLVR